MATGIIGGRYLLPKYPKVIEARDGVVVYENGTAEIVMRDSFGEDMWRVYRSSVEPFYIPEGKQSWGWGPEGYRAPNLTYRGGNQDRVVFTYDSPEKGDLCQQHVFYINRTVHTAHTAVSDLCIDSVLDIHDITHFLGSGIENSERGFIQHIGIGIFETGDVTASTTLPLGYSAVPGASDWEIRHYVFFAVKGDRELEVFALYSLDTTTQVLTDITSQVSLPERVALPIVKYVRNYGDVSGSFVLEYGDGDRIVREVTIVIP